MTSHLYLGIQRGSVPASSRQLTPRPPHKRRHVKISSQQALRVGPTPLFPVFYRFSGSSSDKPPNVPLGETFTTVLPALHSEGTLEESEIPYREVVIPIHVFYFQELFNIQKILIFHINFHHFLTCSSYI